jgi:hypothetical protein
METRKITSRTPISQTFGNLLINQKLTTARPLDGRWLGHRLMPHGKAQLMTLLSQMDDPNYWRIREQQVRKAAERTLDEQRREILWGLVEDYNRLAINAERRLRNEKDDLSDYRFTR